MKARVEIHEYGSTGFPLTKQDIVAYNTSLANEAHARGLLIALKNAPDIVPNHTATHDFSIAEESFKYKETGAYSPFVAAGKAVMAVEYGTKSASKCTKAANLGFTLGFYNLNLNGKKYQPC